MNKKAVAPLVIYGIPVGAIIYLSFELWTITVISDAMIPEIDKALASLDDKIVCPPELDKTTYEICMSSVGEILINGTIRDQLSLNTDVGEACNIQEGKYDYNIVCKFNNIGKAKTITLYENGLKITIGSEKIVYYSSELAALRKPIKTGLLFWKKVRYIPI
jgi:hypothetical protein